MEAVGRRDGNFYSFHSEKQSISFALNDVISVTVQGGIVYVYIEPGPSRVLFCETRGRALNIGKDICRAVDLFRVEQQNRFQ